MIIRSILILIHNNMFTVLISIIVMIIQNREKYLNERINQNIEKIIL
jgi:hypothetical protein